MGGLCSSNKNSVVANKENMGELLLQQRQRSVSRTAAPAAAAAPASSSGANLSAASKEGSPATSTGPSPDTKKGAKSPVVGHGDCKSCVVEEVAGATLDSTAFLSPDPVDPEQQQRRSDGGCDAAAKHDLGVYQSSFLTLQAGEEDNRLGAGGDRSAWLARNLANIRGGASIPSVVLDQHSGLSDCLEELLHERARQLKAMENLTLQLRRREVDTAKDAHDLKALTVRLECAEQDKSSLEQRARATAEEHRMDRARWFVHKQELETRCVQLESRDTQYKASIRRKEVEYGRLQDSMRRVVQRDARSIKSPRGMRTSSDLALVTQSGFAEDGKTTEAMGLAGMVNEQARRKAQELEKENATLRSMLVDLQADVADIKGYHDRHGDLVSAGRAADGDIWGAGTDSEPLRDEVIEGMPADWLQRQWGEETARQILGMRNAVSRVLEEGQESSEGASSSEVDVAGLVSQLREARSLLREQDAIMLAAIFDRPGAEAAIASNRQRCVCGGDAAGTSAMWDTREQLEQDREELERERSKLERDKARFLEEAVRRDSKSFIFSCPPGTPGSPPRGGDAQASTPSRHRHLSAAGTLIIPDTPSPHLGKDLPLLTFTPPGASPDTARLLGDIGIQLANERGVTSAS